MSAWYPPVRNFSAFSTRSGVLTRPSREGSSPSCSSSCWMRSCIGVLYMLLLAAPAAAASLHPASSPDVINRFDAQSAAGVPAGDPDALYADRETLASATKAVEIWTARLAANPRD